MRCNRRKDWKRLETRAWTVGRAALPQLRCLAMRKVTPGRRVALACPVTGDFRRFTPSGGAASNAGPTELCAT